MKFIKYIAILLVLITLILVVFDQSRSIYCLAESKCVTVWKRLGNKCYIIPGKYYGIFKPSDNFVFTTNTNAITIIAVDSTSVDYAIYNDFGKEIELNFSNYNVKYYPLNERDSFIDNYYINGHIKKGVKYMQIDIGENLIIVNGIIQ